MNQYVKKFRKHIMAKQTELGNCSICRQRDVKTRRLWCKRHNYCMVCAEFVQRLGFGDFRCQKCAKENKQSNTKDKEDCSLESRTDGRARRHRKPTPEFDKRVNFDDSEDDDDLEGYNQDLDQLLESLTKPATPVKIQPPKVRREKIQPENIQRKTSFLHLSLPYAHEDVTDRTKSPNANLICSTVTQLLNSPLANTLPGIRAESTSVSFPDSRLNSSASSRNDSNSKNLTGAQAKNTCTNRILEMDPKEEERNTSPCKGMRPRSCQSWHDESPHHVTSPVSESENLLELIGKIQGPDFDSSSSSRSGSDSSVSSAATNMSSDDFWDTKIR